MPPTTSQDAAKAASRNPVVKTSRKNASGEERGNRRSSPIPAAGQPPRNEGSINRSVRRGRRSRRGGGRGAGGGRRAGGRTTIGGGGGTRPRCRGSPARSRGGRSPRWSPSRRRSRRRGTGRAAGAPSSA